MRITCDVLQGSTNDPVLFILHINVLSLSANFFVIFLLMTQNYAFLMTIPLIWRKK